MSATETGSGFPSVDFTAFVLSLSTAALQHLGQDLSGIPDAPQATVNLPLAQQTIDILAMLHKKTSGNLTTEEAKLLGTILHDLRMRYVEAARGTGV